MIQYVFDRRRLIKQYIRNNTLHPSMHHPLYYMADFNIKGGDNVRTVLFSSNKLGKFCFSFSFTQEAFQMMAFVDNKLKFRITHQSMSWGMGPIFRHLASFKALYAVRLMFV